jgi:hypothetical protein
VFNHRQWRKHRLKPVVTVQPVQSHGATANERSDCGAIESLQHGSTIQVTPHIPAQRADICARATFDVESESRGLPVDEFEVVNIHGTGSEFDRFTAPGEIVGPFSTCVNSRELGRDLHDPSTVSRKQLL